LGGASSSFFLRKYPNYLSKFSGVNKNSINPNFVTGLCDGEASFGLGLNKVNDVKVGWSTQLVFSVVLHTKELNLLELLKLFFCNVGNFTKYKDSTLYRVQSIKGIEVIINHFDSFPLITQKWYDYQLFKQAFVLVKSKQHLTIEGIIKIVAIKASMNLSLSLQLKQNFPDVIPVPKPLVQNQEIKDPHWLAGFVSGEGCFFIHIQVSKPNKIGSSVKLRFKLTQHSRDTQLIKSFVDYLGCGKVEFYSQSSAVDFVVTKISDINEKIIPFLNKYSIFGIKALDFEDFCKAAEIIKNKEHLTIEGLKKIEEIKGGMNTRRIS
jgi:LAGLIDADG endonuclease